MQVNFNTQSAYTIIHQPPHTSSTHSCAGAALCTMHCIDSVTQPQENSYWVFQSLVNLRQNVAIGEFKFVFASQHIDYRRYLFRLPDACCDQTYVRQKYVRQQVYVIVISKWYGSCASRLYTVQW
jgi:hypothetical protein